jgi:phytol kinase
MENEETIAIFTWTLLNMTIMLAIWSIAGYLKRRNLRTGYCRKIWQITSSTVGIFTFFYLPMQVSFLLFVSGSTFLFYVVLKDGGNFFFEAIARESDSPHRGLYVIIPAYTAIFGVFLARHFFGPFAQLGALTLGWGDSMGEIIGVRFGKHRYSVPTLLRVKGTRSMEGSFAVFLTSFFSLLIGIEFFMHIDFYKVLPQLILMSMIVTGIEAISPHGTDNFTIPFITSLTANLLLSH